MKEALINFQKVTKPLELTSLWMVEYIARSGHQEQKQCFSQVTSVSIFRNISSLLLLCFRSILSSLKDNFVANEILVAKMHVVAGWHSGIL